MIQTLFYHILRFFLLQLYYKNKGNIMKKEFSKEELESMIQAKNLKIMLVAEVSTKTMGFYKIVVKDEEELQRDLKLYDLTLDDTEYMLLTDKEIKHIQQKDYV